MAQNLDIEQTALGIAIRDLEQRIEKPQVFLNQVGLILVGISQKAFRDQSFDGIPWEARYPNQNGAKLNIAGALKDAEAGASAPKARRFQDRPAAIDTGALKNSISYTVSGDSVIVGTTNPHAQITQEGGETAIPITDAMRRTIAGWMRKSRKAVKRAKSAATFSPKAFDRNEALGRLRFVFFKRNGQYLVPVKKTTVNARPFIGLTDEARKKIEAWGARWFSTGKGA